LLQLKTVKVVQKYFSTLLKISFLLIISTNQILAQTGKIAGKVTDKSTGETLIGLSVGIDGSTRGSATDVEGRYVISNLAPGKYNLIFRYLGYQTKSITGVEVAEGKVTSLNVVMDESSTQSLAEVVVTASYRQETVGALFAQQKNAVSISSGISSEVIQRSPDKNTSEVLKRVSGASIQNNKFVVIRGLADRYNTTLLNNAILPSTEPDKKAFSFDIIPSNLVDKIVINKTASADLPGDFAGGIIQIVTKDVPDASFISFSTSWGYNSQSTGKDFISNERGKYDYLGFDNGARSLPAAFPNSFQKYNPLSDQEKVTFTKLLPNSYAETIYKAMPSQNHQITWGNRKDFSKGGSLGSIVSFSYRNAQNMIDVQRNDYENQFQDTYYNYSDQQYSFNTNLGLLANITYKKGNNKIGFKNLYNRVFDQIYTSREGFNVNIDGNLRFNNSDLTQKTILNSQLEGDHQFGKKDQKLNWNLSYSLIKRDQPDLRSIYYRQKEANSTSYDLVDRNSRRFFSDLSEDNISGQVNYSLPFTYKNKKHIFKTGLLNVYKTRDFSARIFNYLYKSTGSASYDDYMLSLPKGQIFASDNIKTSGGFILSDFTNTTDSYQAQTLVNAGYTMVDSKFSEKSRLVWGARVEQYYQNIDYIDLSGRNRSFDQTFLDILPSVNYSYAINDQTNIRLSGSKTVSRPELRELAPFAFYDFVTQTSALGDPTLKRGQINNLDLKYEIYPKNGEAITFSLFYKDFNDAIEQTLDEGGSPERRQINFQNIDKASSYGIEFEMRKKLDFISDKALFEDLTFFTNLSYIKSEVKLNSVGIDSRPLQGQSPYLINAGLQYSGFNNGLTLTALYNRVGQRIAFVGNSSIPSIWENSRDIVDLQISKKILKKNAEIKLNFGDILNQNSIFYFNQDDKDAYKSSIDKDYVSNKLGSNISLSFSYNFSLSKK
jgi:outer membrane receptor protein involved in Fe transport